MEYFKRILWIVVLCFSASLLVAKEDFSTKERACLKIFNKLKKAKGLLEGRPPFLHFRTNLDTFNTDPNRKLRMAIAFPNGDIYLEEFTYDICKDLMNSDWENGLAFILAHEIVHYTRRHNVQHKYLDKKFNKKNLVEDIRKHVKDTSVTGDEFYKAYSRTSKKHTTQFQEAEADLEAGFMSYLAGYESMKAGAIFLKEAYRTFEIDTSGVNYVSLSERIEIVQQAGRDLNRLIHVFEAGNYASMSGEYDAAMTCYDYVSKSFESKELLNNMGVIGLSKIIDMIPIVDIGPYRLPISFDMDLVSEERQEIIFNLPMSSGGSVGEYRKDDIDSQNKLSNKDAFELKNNLLDRCIEYFDRAMAMDPNYYAPALNKSVAYYLRHKARDLHLFPSDELDIAVAEASAINAKKRLLKDSSTDSLKLAPWIDIINQLLVINHIKEDKEKTQTYTRAIRLLSSEGSIEQMNVRYVCNEGVEVSNNQNSAAEIGDNLYFKGEEEITDIYEDPILMEIQYNEHRIEWDTSIVLSTKSNWKESIYFQFEDSFVTYKITKDEKITSEHFAPSSAVVIFVPKDNYELRSDIIGKDDELIIDYWGMPEKEVTASNGGSLKYYGMLPILSNQTQNGIIYQSDHDGVLEKYIIVYSVGYSEN